MKYLRGKLTYANVMASLAVFLVLGGATAWAALGKNTVGSKQLKKNSVTAAKIKKNAVTNAKLKNNAVTTAKIKNSSVTGDKVKNGSLTGSDINLATLGTVPSATSAGTAAKTSQIANIFFAANEGEPKQTILNFAGLTLQATCPPGGENEIEATTSVSHSVIDVVTAQDNDYEGNVDFNAGEVFDFDLGHSQGVTEMYTAQYTRPDGVNVALFLHDVDAFDGPAFPGTPAQRDCLVAGIAFTS